MSYIEAKGRMKKGDRIWQIAFGSGFKCNSAVWKCNRTIKTPTDGPWDDCIDRYPVFIPEIVKLLTILHLTNLCIQKTIIKQDIRGVVKLSKYETLLIKLH